MSQIQNRSAVSFIGSPRPHMNIGSMLANGNTAGTVISTIDVFVDLNLDALAVPGSNIALWSVTDTTTGELTYAGPSAFNGSFKATIAASSQGSQFRYLFRVVKNGSPLAEGIEDGVLIGNSEVRVSLLVPAIADPGDTIRLQVANSDGTTDMFIRDISVEIS